MIGYILVWAILTCWPASVVLFFTSIFIGFPWRNGVNMMQRITTWPQLFAAINGSCGFRARLYGVVFFLFFITGLIGFGSFFIGGIFCS